MRSWIWAAVSLAVLGLPTVASAQHHGGHCEPYVQPILSVADVNADGAVTNADVRDVIAHQDSYHPLYDLNADGRINGRDVAAAARQIGDDVPLRDTQLASAALATMDFYGPGGMVRALMSGYLPFTATFAGHGVHLLNFNKIYYDEFDVANVPGLNFDENGQLVAVFYIRTIQRDATGLGVVAEDDHPPIPSFDTLTADDWHYHQSVWISGLGSTNPADVKFEQYLPIPEVVCRVHAIGGPANFFPNSSNLYSPKFWMLHAWVHSINPCGVFAGTNPEVAIGYPNEHLASWDPADSWCY